MKPHRDSNDRLTFALEVEASSYAKLVDKAKARFDLSPACDRVDGLDEIFQEFTQGKLRVGLEWDNWTCFTIVAKSPASEGLAEDIARFLALCLPAT